MSKTDYTKLDEAILKAISEHQPLGFTALSVTTDVAGLSAELERESAAMRGSMWRAKPAFRFIDSRLQVLRRAGKIRFQRKPEGWVLA